MNTTMLTHAGSTVEQLADLLTVPARRRSVLVNDRGHIVGQDHHRAELTDHDVWLIHELLAEGVTCRQVAEKFDVSRDTIKAISCGRRRAQTGISKLTGRPERSRTKPGAR